MQKVTERKGDKEGQEGQSCDVKGDEHGGSKRTIGTKDVLELILLGAAGLAITIFAGGSKELQQAGLITPMSVAPRGLSRNGDDCPYCI